MRKQFLAIIVLITISLLWAGNDRQHKIAPQSQIVSASQRDELRDPPQWSISIPPMSLITSYYDYMIGGYNSLPLGAVPPEYGDGYFFTYHGKRTPTGVRRVFYGYVNNIGDIIANNEITSVQITECFPSMAIDPLNGKPFYVWQANVDGEAALEVQMSFDAYIDQIPGLMSDPFIVLNNPVTIQPTNDNEFIFPIVQVGPSPTSGMRRVYILGKNNVTHTSGSCENPYIAYADYNASMLESGQTLTWSYISIPLMNQWNNDPWNWRQPFYSFCVGNDGKIFVVGYHSNDQLDVPVNAPDLDVFVCDNYGQGTWQYYNYSSHIPVYNPHTSNGSGPGYFVDANSLPFADNQIFLKITNSSHLNAVVDDNGIVHMIGLWGLGYQNGNLTSDINTIKEVTFNGNTHAFGIREIFPKAVSSSDNLNWLPWDNNANGVTDSYDADTGNPVVDYDWNYPYWDEAAHDNTMIAHYNNLKITKPNAAGQMAAVWQNSKRARQLNHFDNAEYLSYADVPEIYIAVSFDFGINWSDPIILNSVDVPELAGNRPMWVYPADKIKYVDSNAGLLGLLFLHDNTWGSGMLASPVGPNNGGQVKFMEIQIGEGEYPPLQSGILGYVRRADNYQPISNAAVVSSFNSEFTDINGYYCLDLSAGFHPVMVQASNYVTQNESSIYIPNNSYVTRHFLLQPIAINGYVRREGNNQPIHNATVSTGSYSTTTDANGFYRLNLPHGTYNLFVEAVGYASQLVMNINLPNHENAYQNFLLAVTGCSVSGNIVRGNSQLPVTGAFVQLTSDDQSYSTSTDADGYYILYNLPCQHTYSITVSKLNYDTYSGTFRVYESNVQLPDITLYRVAGIPVDVTATVSTNNVYTSINWNTPRVDSERNLSGYRIWRLIENQEENPDSWVFLEQTPYNIRLIFDNAWQNLPSNTYVYAVKAVYTGEIVSPPAFSNTLFKPVANIDNNLVPKVTRLTSGSPNPFSSNTQINYDLKSPGKVKIDIYNLAGQHVCTLLESQAKAGSHTVNWNGRNKAGNTLPSGIYLCKLVSGKAESTLKLILMK